MWLIPQNLKQEDMKKVSIISLIVSVFVLPCILDLEKFGVCAVIFGCVVVSLILNKKFNPEIFV